MSKEPQRIPIAERLAQLNKDTPTPPVGVGVAGAAGKSGAAGNAIGAGASGARTVPGPAKSSAAGKSGGAGNAASKSGGAGNAGAAGDDRGTQGAAGATATGPGGEPAAGTSQAENLSTSFDDAAATATFTFTPPPSSANALTVTQAGRLDVTGALAAVDVGALPFNQATNLDPNDGQTHHLLVVGEDVDSRELEALALSIWEDASWIGPGQLRLTGPAQLRGPFRLEANARRQLKTPQHLEQVWVVDVEPYRGGPAPEFFRQSDPIAAAFPDAVPSGLELQVLQALRRVARRLAGVIRAAGTGNLIEPDADASVAMTVYAPRWIDEEDLSQLLRPYLPDVVNSQNADRLARIDSPERVQNREELAKQIGIPEDEWERIAQTTRAADKKALSREHVVRGYSLLASAGNTSRIHCTVTPSEYVPTALRFENWPDGTAIEYAITWVPPQVYLTKLNKPGRAIRLERMRVKDQIEHIATLVARSTGGFVVDEDQFLVALE